MRYLYRFYFLLILFFLQSCSGSESSGPVDPAANLPLNNTAIETCYDLKVTINNNRQSQNVCTTIENGGENGLGISKLIRFNLNAAANVSIQVTRTDGLNPSDPDIILYKEGRVAAFADSPVTSLPNQESIATRILASGAYVIEVREFIYFNTERVVFKQSRAQQKISATFQQAITATPCEAVSDSSVSGFVTFDRVNFSGTRLNYNDITQEPVQQALVEVICNGFVYSAGVTDARGEYSINYPQNQDSIVRVSARMLNAAFWDFSVVDNTIQSQPVYSMQSNVFVESANFRLNLRAGSGWDADTRHYLFTRVAAPFAILDSVRKAKDKVRAVANVTFPPLKINWSPSNSRLTVEGTLYDGEEILLLGLENVDTDEFDEHVIIHEWAHYFEDKFSRSDSIGGTHSRGDILDIRLAFGEGFGNAFSAMVLDDPIYIDTSGNRQSKSFSFSMDENNCTNSGWFSECSVHSVLYDLYDITDVAEADNLNLGFLPIYNVMTGAQKNTAAMTSIFSFIKALKNENISSANEIDTLLFRQRIDSVSDDYGRSQISVNPGSTDQLPIYQSL